MKIKQAINKVKQMVTPAEEDDWFDNSSNNNDSYEHVQPDNWRWELEYEEILANYEHSLKREYRNSKGQWIKINGTEPVMSEQGIAFTMSDLRSMLHRGTALGAVKIAYTNDMAKAKAYAYKAKVVLNLKRFEVDSTDIEPLVLSYLNMVYMVLTRPVNDGERKIRAKMFGFKENYAHDEVSAGEISGSYKI